MEFGIIGLWTSMGMIAKLVVILLVILSIYSLTLSGERWWRYRQAKTQSLQFALLTTQYLKQDRPQDAIAASKKFKHSHLAKVKRQSSRFLAAVRGRRPALPRRRKDARSRKCRAAGRRAGR